jgi:chromosomal replication initiation ATPase DnaA
LISELNDDAKIIQVDKPDLTSENVVHIWQNFITYIKPKSQNAFVSIIENQTPIVEQHKLRLTVSNNINLEMLQSNKSEIVSYFIQHTNTKKLELEILMIKSAAEKPLHKTPKERAKELFEKHGSVKYLIQKLELGLDA